jgi:hypothetical protein
MSSPSTIAQLERQVRQLRLFALVATVGVSAYVGSAFVAPQSQRARFDEIDVERLNVRSADGKYAVVIANASRMPGNIVDGREHAAGRRGGGLLFYNAQGDEAGGLIFDSDASDSGVTAFGQLSLDRFKSDQVVVLRYLEDPDAWSAGLLVSHYTRGAISEWHRARDSILALPPVAHDTAIQSLRRRFFRAGKWEIQRVFVGERGRTAVIRMNDTRGRERIRMIVDSLDIARLEFLNDSGRVVYRIPN